MLGEKSFRGTPPGIGVGVWGIPADVGMFGRLGAGPSPEPEVRTSPQWGVWVHRYGAHVLLVPKEVPGHAGRVRMVRRSVADVFKSTPA